MASAVLFERHPLERTVRWLDGLAPQVIAVKLDQVEGVEEDACVMPPVTDAIEARHAVVITGDRFSVDSAGARADEGLDDQRETTGQVVPGAAVEPDTVAVLAGDDAETVMLETREAMRPRNVVSPTWLACSTHAYVVMNFPSKSGGEEDEQL